MDILDTPTRPQVGADIEWLATHLHGPRAMRRRLAAWARDYAAEADRSLASDRLREALRSLVTLAHANAAVSFVEAPTSVGARPEVQFDDLGGYGACLFSLVDLLDSLPLPESEITDLQNFARAVRAEQEEQIRQTLFRCETGSRPQ